MMRSAPLKLARRLVCETPSYSLDALRNIFKVSVGERHQALADVQALVELFRKVYRPRLERARVNSFGAWAAFSLAKPISQCWSRALAPGEIEQGLRQRDRCLSEQSWARVGLARDYFYSAHLHRELEGIYRRAKRNARMEQNDFVLIFQLLDRFPHLREQWPGDFLFNWIRDHAPSGVLVERDQQSLLDTLRRLLHPDPESTSWEEMDEGFDEAITLDISQKHEVFIDSESGIGRPTVPGPARLDLPQSVIFINRSFCFTGKFAFGTRTDCEKAVIEKGGRCTRRPTRDTDYLVVGSLGGFGAKVEEVESLKRSGSQAQVIEETLWVECLQSVRPSAEMQ